MQSQSPYKVYSPNDLIKDSGYWDYLQYLQLNRISFLTTTIWDDRKTASNKLLNLVSAVDTLEFLCADKLKAAETKLDYEKNKPLIFKDIYTKTNEIRRYIESDAYDQLKMKTLLTQWLKSLNVALGSMKRVKRVNVMAGEGVTSFEAESEE